MLSIYTDSTDFTKSKLKPKDADRICNLLHQSISYLSSSVQLNVIAYTILEEQETVMAVLSNYQGFMEQTLLDPKYDGKSLAWKIDNFSKGDSNNFIQLIKGIFDKVDELINSTENLLIEEKEDDK